MRGALALCFLLGCRPPTISFPEIEGVRSALLIEVDGTEVKIDAWDLGEADRSGLAIGADRLDDPGLYGLFYERSLADFDLTPGPQLITDPEATRPLPRGGANRLLTGTPSDARWETLEVWPDALLAARLPTRGRCARYRHLMTDDPRSFFGEISELMLALPSGRLLMTRTDGLITVGGNGGLWVDGIGVGNFDFKAAWIRPDTGTLWLTDDRALYRSTIRNETLFDFTHIASITTSTVILIDGEIDVSGETRLYFGTEGGHLLHRAGGDLTELARVDGPIRSLVRLGPDQYLIAYGPDDRWPLTLVRCDLFGCQPEVIRPDVIVSALRATPYGTLAGALDGRVFRREQDRWAQLELDLDEAVLDIDGNGDGFIVLTRDGQVTPYEPGYGACPSTWLGWSLQNGWIRTTSGLFLAGGDLADVEDGHQVAIYSIERD